MTANPADIARYTNDGVLLMSNAAAGAAIVAAHPNARDGSGSEIEMFYDNAADAQTMLDQKFALLSKVNPAHVGVEIEDDIGFGETIPIAPTVPCFEVIDEALNQDVVARTRAFAHDTGSDRFSLEMLA